MIRWFSSAAHCRLLSTDSSATRPMMPGDNNTTMAAMTSSKTMLFLKDASPG